MERTVKYVETENGIRLSYHGEVVVGKCIPMSLAWYEAIMETDSVPGLMAMKYTAERLGGEAYALVIKHIEDKIIYLQN